MLSTSFCVDTNKLTCQMCLLRVTWVDPLITLFLSCRFRIDPFMTQTYQDPTLIHKNPCRVHVVFTDWVEHLTPLLYFQIGNQIRIRIVNVKQSTDFLFLDRPSLVSYILPVIQSDPNTHKNSQNPP